MMLDHTVSDAHLGYVYVIEIAPKSPMGNNASVNTTTISEFHVLTE